MHRPCCAHSRRCAEVVLVVWYEDFCAQNYESNNHHIPHGMVRPQQLDGLQHNGHGASYAASGHNQTTSVNNVQRYNSMNAGLRDFLLKRR
jgi:hypothetical protein